MQEPRPFFKALQKFYPFTSIEIRDMAISVLLMGFIISFREWGVTSFEVLTGLKNFANGIIVSLLVLLVFVSGQRFFGIRTGFRIEYKLWLPGIVIALIVAFATRGFVWLLIPGAAVLHHMAGHRLGYFRHKTMLITLAVVNIMGPILCLGLAIIFKIFLTIMPTNVLVEKVMILSIVFALVNMLPIPPLAGSHLVYSSRLGYAFTFGAMIGFGYLLLKTNIVLSLLGGALIGGVIWLSYYVFLENKL